MIRYLLPLCIICFFCVIPAQEIEFDYPLGYPESLKKSPLQIDKKKEYSVLRERSIESQKPSSFLSGFDQQIDEHSYILGTGDGFTIYLWGSVNDEIEAVIGLKLEVILIHVLDAQPFPGCNFLCILNRPLREVYPGHVRLPLSQPCRI